MQAVDEEKQMQDCNNCLVQKGMKTVLLHDFGCKMLCYAA